MIKRKISAMPSVRRLPSYLHIIRQAEIDGLEFISGTLIAEELDLEPIQVRKDLAITGIVGKPKKGYPVKELIVAINHFLGWDKTQKAIIVGAGNLGTALSGYQEFKYHGLKVCAAFDSNPEKIGTTIHDVPVYDIVALPEKVKELEPSLAILTLPSLDGQAIADMLIDAGITALWNFTNVRLKVPSHVCIQREDLTSGYALLGVMINNRNADEKLN